MFYWNSKKCFGDAQESPRKHAGGGSCLKGAQNGDVKAFPFGLGKGARGLNYLGLFLVFSRVCASFSKHGFVVPGSHAGTSRFAWAQCTAAFLEPGSSSKGPVQVQPGASRSPQHHQGFSSQASCIAMKTSSSLQMAGREGLKEGDFAPWVPVVAWGRKVSHTLLFC